MSKSMSKAKTDATKKRFLAALRETGNVTKAALLCKFPRSTVYDWRLHDAEFAKAADAAIDEGVNHLIDEAHRRAHDGVREPVYYLGEVCGTIVKYSDSLLMFLIKGRRPEFATESRRMSGPDGGPIRVANLTDDQVKAEYEAMITKLGLKTPAPEHGQD